MNKFSLIKYKIMKNNKCIQVSYSQLCDENGSYLEDDTKRQLNGVINRDLKFYKNSILNNFIVQIYIDNKLYKEVVC